MKNINPEESGTRQRSLSETLIFYTVFFLISEFCIVRPLMKRIAGRQMNKRQEIEEQRKNQEIASSDNLNGGSAEVNSAEESKYIVLENDHIKLTFSSRGLLFNDLILKKYTDVGENVRLLEAEKFVSIGWLSAVGNIEVPGEDTLWNVENASDSSDDINKNNKNRITLYYDNGISAKFKVVLTLDEKYLLTVEQIVENNLDSKILVQPLWRIEKKIGEVKNRNDLFSFNGGLGVFDDKIYEVKTKKLKSNSREFFNPAWAGITDKYWLVAIVGENPAKEKVNFMGRKNTLELRYTTTGDVEVLGKSKVSVSGRMFVGPKDLEILKEYSKNANIKLLDRSIDFGIFYFLAKPINDLLNFLYKITKNFGLAIILLTVVIKAILYPMVRKSFVTIALMKEMQPKIKMLQSTYGSDAAKFREETVKLYKKYDLNPFASIFPIFIQIPIFFSLYKVISVSLNMRQAPFFWFIEDLSAADPSNALNLFGLLPYSTNFRVGLLPCIMAITMYLQQKLSSSVDDEPGGKNKASGAIDANAGIAKFMPLIFLIMFASFPSGLLLYWIFNNIITIAQQYYVVNIYIRKHRKVHD
jgi:YidC/Oxa1 family membrane protein insertase